MSYILLVLFTYLNTLLNVIPLLSFTVVCRYEHFFGPLATHSLCVTTAMKDDLQKNWGIR